MNGVMHRARTAGSENPMGKVKASDLSLKRAQSLPLDIVDELLTMQKLQPDVEEHLGDLQLLWADVRESMKAVKDIQRGRYDKHRDAWDR